MILISNQGKGKKWDIDTLILKSRMMRRNGGARSTAQSPIAALELYNTSATKLVVMTISWMKGISDNAADPLPSMPELPGAVQARDDR
ncbi:MAG: hypothetical protein DMF62_05000 [Acidobacteria bacterium]|nr:MAG: hypothetical protein DMF62_05000 [Acidobacteriota bacterium]